MIVVKLERYKELKILLDEEESRIEEFLEKCESLSITELKNEFLTSVKYAKEIDAKIEQGVNDATGHSYSVNAYAELCTKFTLLLYQYATLLAYNRNLEKQFENPKQKKKKPTIKMLDRQMNNSRMKKYSD